MKPNCFLFLCFTVILSFSVSYISAQIPVTGNYTVYYGSLHNHTNVSDGTGTPDQAYKYARDVAGLDFFGLADHSNLMSSTEWTAIKNAANLHNRDGELLLFTVLNGPPTSPTGMWPSSAPMIIVPPDRPLPLLPNCWAG